MKFPIQILLIILVLSFPVSRSDAGHDHDHSHEGMIRPIMDAGDIVVKPNEIVLETKGIVCSFCSYGVEKKLKKLKFLDHSKKNETVLTEIENGRITLSILPDEKIDFREIQEAVQKGGYELLRMHLNLSGTFMREGQKTLLKVSPSQQLLEITGEMTDKFSEGEGIHLQVHLEGEDASSFIVDQIEEGPHV